LDGKLRERVEKACVARTQFSKLAFLQQPPALFIQQKSLKHSAQLPAVGGIRLLRGYEPLKRFISKLAACRDVRCQAEHASKNFP
jgi:hypothetical protein